MSRETLSALAQAIHTHPSFPAAARDFVSDYTNWRGQLGAENQVFWTLPRFNLVTRLLFLHYASVGEAGPSEATLAKLRDFSDAEQGMGERGIRTALRLLQAGRLVVAVRRSGDRRVTVFEPTSRLLALAQGYFDAVFGVFDALLPQAGLRARMRMDPQFFPTVLSRIGRAFLGHGPGAFQQEGPLAQLLFYGGAGSVVAVIVDAYWRGGRLPAPGELAARFKLSPSQVRNLLAAAAAQGFVSLGSRGQILDAAPLVEEYLRIYCLYFAFIARFGLDLEAELLAC